MGLTARSLIPPAAQLDVAKTRAVFSPSAGRGRIWPAVRLQRLDEMQADGQGVAGCGLGGLLNDLHVAHRARNIGKLDAIAAAANGVNLMMALLILGSDLWSVPINFRRFMRTKRAPPWVKRAKASSLSPSWWRWC